MRQARSSGQSIEMRSVCGLLSVLLVENSRSAKIFFTTTGSRNSFRTHCRQSHVMTEKPTTCADTAEDITLLLSKMIRACYGFRYHRTRRTPLVVGTGSAVSPCYPLLVCAKLATR